MLLAFDSSRNALLQPRRFVDAREPLHLRFEALEGGAYGQIEVARGLQKLLAFSEGLAAVAGHGQPSKKHAGAFAELLRNGGQVCGALFSAQ